jgi:arginyl-tRNA synthetase
MFSTLSIAAQRILDLGDTESVRFELPKESTFGDATTTAALQLAKKLGKNPRDIAKQLADGLASEPSVMKVEVAGPGYVNVWLKEKDLIDELHESQSALQPKKPAKKDAPVIVEYSQPNIAKPLAIHHILSTMIGESISRLYEHAGLPVLRWNYLGDWGTQFGKLAVAFKKWGTKPITGTSLDELLDLYVQFHTKAEAEPELEDEGREAFRKLEQGDADLRAFWQEVISITKASLGHIYDELDVHFDLDLGESFYEDKMQSVIDEGKKKGVFIEGEKGSLIVKFADDKYPPYIIVKADGATLYSTRDLAQMKYRAEHYHPQKILIATDVAQKLHFEQLHETCTLLGWELPPFEHIIFGRMSFADSSMSTRKGNVLKLEHVLEEAVDRARAIIKERGEAIQTDDEEDLAQMMGIGALVYGILSQNRKMDMIFDWNKMLSFDGNSAPYIQYTHARARSVLRKAAAEQWQPSSEVPTEFTLHERALIHALLVAPLAFDEALQDHMPHKIANFLYQVAQAFNAFYNSDSILQAESDRRAFRLYLVLCTADTIRTCARLLSIRVPDRM